MKVEARAIDQVLIAAGGSATRLRAGGIDLPDGKSLKKYDGVTLLQEVLETKIDSGFSRFVIAAETPERLRKIEAVVDKVSETREMQEVVLFQDKGLGTNGLPYQARHVLDEEFVFDFGHNDSKMARSLANRKAPGIVVFTGFPVKGISDHPVVHYDHGNGLIRPAQDEYTKQVEVAAPFILDHEWIGELPQHDFNFAQMVHMRAQREDAIVVEDIGVPGFLEPNPEFDMPSEYLRQFAPATSYEEASRIDAMPNVKIPDGYTPDDILHFQENYRAALRARRRIPNRSRNIPEMGAADVKLLFIADLADSRPYEMIERDFARTWQVITRGILP